MEKIGEILSCLLSTSTLKAAVDEIQTLLRSSTAKATAGPSTTRESKELALEEKHASLMRLSSMLEQHQKEVKRVVDDLEEAALKVEVELIELDLPEIPPHVLVHFVDVMDQANQYFDFKELAKLSYCLAKPIPNRTEISRTLLRNKHPYFSKIGEISRTLLRNKHLFSDFSKIGEPQVTQVANAIFWELIDEQHTERDPALFDWIHNLVYETRVKGYVMNQDPIAELKKMMRSNGYFYDRYFLSQQLPVECSERMVMEARSKYSDLVSIMISKYKETSSEDNKFASTASEMDTKPKRPFVMTGENHGSPEKRRRL